MHTKLMIISAVCLIHCWVLLSDRVQFLYQAVSQLIRTLYCPFRESGEDRIGGGLPFAFFDSGVEDLGELVHDVHPTA